jgi:hypothetical protein
VSGGFLGTAASRKADITLLVEPGTGLALVFGAVLARRRRCRAPGWCQSAVVLLNLPVIVSNTPPSFYRQIVPSIHAGFDDWYHLLAFTRCVLDEPGSAHGTDHSQRSATRGSTRVARIAGTMQASTATRYRPSDSTR